MAHCVQEEGDFSYALSVVHVTICVSRSSWGSNMWCCTIYRMEHPKYLLPTSSFCCVPPPNTWAERHFPSSLFSVFDRRRSRSLSSYSVNWCAQFLTRLRWVIKRFVVCHVCYIFYVNVFFCVTDVFAIIYSSVPQKTLCCMWNRSSINVAH
jgi:hypothetical protein